MKRVLFVLTSVVLLASIFSIYTFVLADTTSTLRPTSDGGEDSADWTIKGGTRCNATNCYTSVNEASGSSCTNSDGDSTYIQDNNVGTKQTFDIDESGIPNNVTITNIAITTCHSRGGSQSSTFQTRYCNGGSCTSSGSDITTSNAYVETTQNHAVNFTKTSGSDIEIGVESTSNRRTRVSQISAIITYTIPITSTASVDTSWVKGGSTGKNVIVTVNNAAASSAAIQWIKITRPSSNYTLTAGSASGWSAAVTAGDITFTGGSIASGGSSTFTVTLDTGSVDETQAAWTVMVDDDSSGGSTTSASASSGGALNTGIDTTAPSPASISSVTANSDTQLTTAASTASDSGSGLHATTYWFDETSGNSGATDSTSWQSDTSFVDSGLAASTEYCYRVKTRDAVLNESTFSAPVCQTTNAAGADTTAPSAVSNLAADSPTGNSIRITWTAPGDDGGSGTASSYDIRYSTAAITEGNWGSATQATGEPAPKTAGSSEAFTVGGLSVSTTYYFAIKTRDEASNESDISNIASQSTTSETDTTPPAISNIAATNITENSAVITWNTDEVSDSQVEFGPSASYGTLSTLNTTLTTSHSVTISGLSPAILYSYRVKSKDSAGNLANSGNGTFLTPGDPDATKIIPPDFNPPVISDVKISPTHEKATITWNTDEQSFSFLKYGETTSYEFKTDQNTTLLTSHKTTLEKLKPETEYHFQIINEDKKGNRIFSADRVFATSAAPPPEEEKKIETPKVPTARLSDISVVAVRPTSAKITWKTNVPATSQVVFGTSAEALTRLTIEFSTLTEDHSVTVSDLSPKTTYFFRTISRNELGEETRSETGSFQTESLEIQTVVRVEKLSALPPGSPGTQVPRTSAGETVTVVPILPTEGDTAGPEVTLFTFTENPTENTSPVIRGRARDLSGVIAGISYSTDNGVSWHPITDVFGIGSSAAQFSASIPNLRDGNYNVLFRARDNSNNVGKSDVRILIVDVKPPATGANVLFLGNQSLLPDAFGSISTLTGLSHRLVISAVGGATSASVIAKKKTSDPTSGATVDSATLKTDSTEKEKVQSIAPEITIGSRGEDVLRLQQFLVTEGVLNEVFATGYFGNLTQQGIADFQEKYAEEIFAGQELFEANGLLDTATRKKIDDLLGVIPEEHTAFPLTYLPADDLWSGDITFKESGEYELSVRATDGTGQTSVRPLNPFSVDSPGIIHDAKTEKPISGATVTVFQFSQEENDFLPWPGEVFNQANPQITGDDGAYRFLLPPGRYYLLVEHNNYKTFYTDILEFSNHQTINMPLPLLPRPSIPLPVSVFGVKEISLPYFPDFFGMKRVQEVSQKQTALPENIRVMLGKEAPVFALPTESGEPLDIRYLRGKKTILTTWTTWSPLAQIQVPILDTLQIERTGDVRVLLVSVQESPGIVETYLRRGGYTIPSAIDKDGKLTELYPILTLPQHFFIDRKGVLQDVYVGFLNKEELEKKLEKL